jgi:hypothetical protein
MWFASNVKKFEPLLKSKDLLFKLKKESFLIWTRAAFHRFDCSANGGFMNVAINNSGTGQRMSQDMSERGRWDGRGMTLHIEMNGRG